MPQDSDFLHMDDVNIRLKDRSSVDVFTPIQQITNFCSTLSPQNEGMLNIQSMRVLMEYPNEIPGHVSDDHCVVIFSFCWRAYCWRSVGHENQSRNGKRFIKTFKSYTCCNTLIFRSKFFE